jgi:hypothetical protein
MSAIPDYLTSITEIFDKLSRGYHISNADFSLYPELSKYEKCYSEVFEKIGYQLVAHERGFYYFGTDNDKIKVKCGTMAVFIFFLIDFLQNQGKDPYSEIMEAEFRENQLILDLSNSYKDKMKDMGLNDSEDEFKKAIKQLSIYGFASKKDFTFRFLPPIARFLDSCIEIGKKQNDTELEGV